LSILLVLMALNLAPAKQRIVCVADRIAAIGARFDDERDSRAVFTFTYELMTRRIADEFETAGFSDPDWIAVMVEAFSAQFFAAQAAWDAGGPVPDGWSYILKRLAEKRTSVFEELILGMTAHIIFDLPHAVIDAAGAAGLAVRLGDYHRMNDILGLAIDPIQNAACAKYAPYLNWLDTFIKKEDEILTNYGIRVSRGMAWYNAQRLLDPALAKAAEASIGKSPEAIAKQILEPPFFGAVVRFLRWLSSFLRRWPPRRTGAASRQGIVRRIGRT
jgi:hypothetical protein